jgi:hypothetical protein
VTDAIPVVLDGVEVCCREVRGLLP